MTTGGQIPIQKHYRSLIDLFYTQAKQIIPENANRQTDRYTQTRLFLQDLLLMGKVIKEKSFV